MKYSKYIKDVTLVVVLLLFFSCGEVFEENTSYFSPIDQKNKTIVYTGERVGEFKELAKNIAWKSVEKLVLKGYISHNDLYLIRKYTTSLHGNLKELDFREADIFEGRFPDQFFQGNKQLERFVYPRAMMDTGDGVLHKCNAIKEVVIPEEVEILGSYALSVVDDLKEANTNPVSFYHNLPMAKKNYAIPPMVKELKEGCFSWYPYETINLPSGVTKIGSGCFFNAKLRSFSFLDEVTLVEKGIFKGCKNLKKVVLHDKITEIKDFAFENSGIEELIMPESVFRVGKQFIKQTPNLKKIQWSSKITSLDEQALAEIHLEEFYVPKTITKLGRLCFLGALTKRYHLHEDITSLGEGLFNHVLEASSHIEELHVKWKTPPSVGKAFNTAVDFRMVTILYPAPDYSRVKLFVPRGTKKAYENAEGWKKFGTIIEE